MSLDPGRPGPAFETLAVHAGAAPDPQTGAVVPPVSLATTYAQEAVGKTRGYEYSRSGNPTRAALEACLATLEGASTGLAFASGLAASDAVLHLLRPGDHLIIPDDAYGGTFRLVDKVYGPLGIEHTPVHLADPDALAAAWRPTTRMVWLETPSNPTLGVVGIAALAAAVHERGGRLVVDNTFATPYLQRPLNLGADIVVHSTTKYLGGHSDVVGGFVATADAELGAEVAFYQNAVGGVPGPLDCYLVLRGVRTLPVRMDRHCANAAAVSRALAAHPAVDRVLWPGRADHPGHDVAAAQMRDFGGMVSFVLVGGEDAALEVARSVELFTLAESLGAVESLLEHPARMTHASVVGSALEVDPGLLRLSVGLEAAADLVADLTVALTVSADPGGTSGDPPAISPDDPTASFVAPAIPHAEIDLGWVATVTDLGRRHRRNEDAAVAAVVGDRAAIVVCDGVSSSANPHQASAAAAVAALDVLRPALTGPAGDLDALAALLREAVSAAHRAVGGVPEVEPGGYPAAPSTTIVVALVGPGRLAVAGVGDSRAYWLTTEPPEGARLTTDDSWAEEAIAAGVPPDAAYAAPQSHVITRWLGADDAGPEPEVVVATVEQPGLLLVCSDGMWNYFPEPSDLAARAASVGTGAAVIDVARRLVDAANEAGGSDNITVAVAATGP